MSDKRYHGKKILIACSMIEDEINNVFDRFDLKNIEIWWQERGHHNDPDKLHQVIQSEIDRADAAGADTIMLAYGMCGKGAVGWKSQRAVLAMPRFDDCVNIMLCTGKRDRRNYLEAGQMYLTKGWCKDEGALLAMLDKYIEKYGERKGRRAMKLMLDSYTRVTIIDTGCYDLEPVREYAEQCVRELDLTSSIVPGSNHILEKLITGEWNEDIVVKDPGEGIAEPDFEF